MIKTTDTIIAQATPTGKGGVAVIRISGPNVPQAIQKTIKKKIKPRYATYTKFYGNDNRILDEGLVIYFPAPNSFTGEDVLELHTHGSPVIVDQLIKNILDEDTRLAKPGEFSERAFLNGKIDLVQAEAIADLINANSAQAAQSALRSLQGEFSQKISELLEQLIKLRLFVEAAIDFPDEEIDFIAESSVETDLKKILEQIKIIQASAQQGLLLQEGLKVLILGKPNVGKSSLLNRLTERETAIITDIPGTTRDILREHIQIDGLPISLVDTAGLRETADIIELEGINRAWKEIESADVILWLVEAKQFDTADFEKTKTQFYQKSKKHIPIIIVKNKIDVTNEKAESKKISEHSMVAISAKHNLGLNFLRESIKEIVGLQNNEEGIFLARRRHLNALQITEEYLNKALQLITARHNFELVAEDLRLAQQALAEITGEFTSDDLLGKIFAEFCIGK